MVAIFTNLIYIYFVKNPLISDTLSSSELNQLTLNIELTLINLAQGLALSMLASSAIGPLTTLDWHVWPYIATGLLFVLFYWGQAIEHAFSFIRWPINLGHNFIYFLAMITEVILFSQIANPSHWFALNTLLFVVAWLFYWIDLHLIQVREPLFKAAGHSTAYQAILDDQLQALRLIIPGCLVFSLISWWLIYSYPTFFIEQSGHVLLGLVQAILALLIVINLVQRFPQRLRFIGDKLL